MTRKKKRGKPGRPPNPNRDPRPRDGTGKLRPPHWHMRVQAAFLFMTMRKATQVSVGKAIGYTDRTIRRWMEHPSWPDARQEARDTWGARLEDASRAAVLGSVEGGNALLGWEVLQRVDEQYAPPKQKLEHTGKDGGPLQHVVTRVTYRIPDNGRGIAPG